MIIDKKTQQITSIDRLPQILVLNAMATPLDWVTYEDYAKLAVKNKILWSLGSYEIILRGGINAVTGQQSKLVIDTIVAVNSNKSPATFKNGTPTLGRHTLYERDLRICGYCGDICKVNDLTIDHIIPKSRFKSLTGKDNFNVWENVVTACKPCNNKKGDKLLSEVDMVLLYIPYRPNVFEHFILQNRNILADQREFLMKKVPKDSRLHIS